MKTPKTMKIPGAPDDWPEVPVFRFLSITYNEHLCACIKTGKRHGEMVFYCRHFWPFKHCEPVYMEDE